MDSNRSEERVLDRIVHARSSFLLAFTLLLLDRLLFARNDVGGRNVRLVVEVPLDVEAHVRLRAKTRAESRVRHPAETAASWRIISGRSSRG